MPLLDYLLLFFGAVGLFGYGLIFVYPFGLIQFLMEPLGIDTSPLTQFFFRGFGPGDHQYDLLYIIFGNIVVLLLIYFLLARPIARSLRRFVR